MELVLATVLVVATVFMAWGTASIAALEHLTFLVSAVGAENEDG